jgi:hypothetical protein
MNYAQARQLKEGGWHWTSMNDGHVRTAWPCKRYIGPEDKPYDASCDPSEWERCEPHATQEEAERHFYDACLAEVKEEDYGEWHSCSVKGCDNPTKKGLGNRGDGLLFRGEPLCDEHRTKEMIAELRPFKGGISIAHS